MDVNKFSPTRRSERKQNLFIKFIFLSVWKESTRMAKKNLRSQLRKSQRAPLKRKHVVVPAHACKFGGGNSQNRIVLKFAHFPKSGKTWVAAIHNHYSNVQDWSDWGEHGAKNKNMWGEKNSWIQNKWEWTELNWPFVKERFSKVPLESSASNHLPCKVTPAPLRPMIRKFLCVIVGRPGQSRFSVT